jgi:hypothetical protein
LVKKDSLENMYQHCLSLGLKPFYADSAARMVSPAEGRAILPWHHYTLYDWQLSFVTPLLQVH